MSTESTSVEHTAADSSPTGVARCEEDVLAEQSEPYLVHGVAIGANEVTMGANWPKFWPAEELRASAQSLVGVPLTKNHDDARVESVVGEVVDAAFEDDVGVVFEAEVDDREIATKIARGRLEVSVHAIHVDGGRTSAGDMIVEDIQFLDLSVVPRGGSPANFVEAGESPSEALASLSVGDVEAILARSGSDKDNESMTADTDEPEQETELSEADEVDADADAEEAEAEAEIEDEVEEAEAEADETEAEADETEADDDLEEAELAEEIESLRAENQELRNELESVRLEYAERLAEDSPFEAAELAEKFSFDELQTKFEEAEVSLVPGEETIEESTPAPQTGDAEESELSTSSDDSTEEIAQLEAKIEKFDSMGWDAARADAEARLTALRE